MCSDLNRVLPFKFSWDTAMEIIRITTDTSKHAAGDGLLAVSEEAPLYIIEHEGLETRIPGISDAPGRKETSGSTRDPACGKQSGLPQAAAGDSAAW
jgi:hypothetical protein